MEGQGSDSDTGNNNNNNIGEYNCDDNNNNANTINNNTNNNNIKNVHHQQQQQHQQHQQQYHYQQQVRSITTSTSSLSMSTDSVESAGSTSSTGTRSGSPDHLEKDRTNVFVKYLPNEYGDYELFNLFSQFGKVMSAKVMVDAKGNSYGYGFVRFSSPEESRVAIEHMDGYPLLHKKLLCRLSYLYSNGNNRFPSNNLFVKLLPAAMTDDQLKELFQPFGEVVECKVMVDKMGQSKLAGFVRFSHELDATRAIQALNGTKQGDSPALVATPSLCGRSTARILCGSAYQLGGGIDAYAAHPPTASTSSPTTSSTPAAPTII
ncbi:hypothetical protein SAMD00019534_117030 [Acytostelium subglobosum LB1]|uniref:hypothetical protein n=1 Tax=Acytostelium subglobosum LB1 TaxID=1410327 RepID=UPI0006450C7C|nr:hypothetical protein SAMD00019534_117030 [Acytostelium subglobosum LB1]GAM28527.1 hypothetical protein SAMD00019534_117030 [Acytostelium subglobosum LB1]|eukprot:XP_012748566.1 hypothetical protein SAMD00019534_117030 [Acytostelium subglobosum LB1]